MVEWTPVEVAQAAKALGLPLWKVKQMVTTGVLVKERALNGNLTVPEGYIRFADALAIYGLPDSTLSNWIHRFHKVNSVKVSHKERYVCESDIIAQMQRLGRVPSQN